MDTKNNNKLIPSIIIALIVLGALYLVFGTQKVEVPAGPERVDEVENKTPEEGTVKEEPKPAEEGTSVTTSLKQQTLANLKKASSKEDYTAFATSLAIVYENKWDQEEDFAKVESDLYKLADTKYFVAGNYDKMLEVSTIVYKKVPSSWRFPYLRILTLQRLGINALEKGDLVTAEAMAMEILKMKFRPEGANLLADVYIAKIKANIQANNIELAKQNLGFIWDFQVSEDRRATLTTLKAELDKK